MSIISKYYRRIERQYGKQLKGSAKKGGVLAQVALDKIKIHKEDDK